MGMDDLVTLRDLEKESGIGWKKLAYVGERYRIEPTRRVGLIKLYARPEAERLLSAAKRIGSSHGHH
jgi:hypothetical protein